MKHEIRMEDFRGSPSKAKSFKESTNKLWKNFPLAEIVSLHNINHRIENNFGEGKRVIVISKNVARYANRYIKENTCDSEFELGESFLVRECVDVGQDRPYQLMLNGIILQDDRFGFERMFSSGWFCPESVSRPVLQGIGVKFDNFGNIIK